VCSYLEAIKHFLMFESSAAGTLLPLLIVTSTAAAPVPKPGVYLFLHRTISATIIASNNVVGDAEAATQKMLVAAKKCVAKF
jgi:hypothetical protein